MAYTTIDNPELYFQTKIYTADQQANRLITLDGSENMQPDWVWLKNRNSAVTHDLYDSVRGATKYISSDQTTAEATNADGLVAFNTNGFTVDTSWGNYATGNGYVAWCWKAGGSSSTNEEGSIDSTVSANTTSGFSIVKWSGSGANATIGHGLGVSPKMVITKSLGSSAWCVYNENLANTNVLFLDTTAATSAHIAYWNNTSPTSTVFSVGTDDAVNHSGNNMIAYCFAEKQGFSKFGSYTGNGNADGTFVYTGFRPAWILIKRSSTAGNDWGIFDNKRLGYNVNNEELRASSTDAEQTDDRLDILSNGFKIRLAGAGFNASGDTFIYAAFAENPFVTSSGVPATAR